tara:strand:+ start:148 stop:519 length:372 start_codon:yes stop_codon:yes gene_type:complete
MPQDGARLFDGTSDALLRFEESPSLPSLRRATESAVKLAPKWPSSRELRGLTPSGTEGVSQGTDTGSRFPPPDVQGYIFAAKIASEGDSGDPELEEAPLSTPELIPKALREIRAHRFELFDLL